MVRSLRENCTIEEYPTRGGREGVLEGLRDLVYLGLFSEFYNKTLKNTFISWLISPSLKPR